MAINQKPLISIIVRTHNRSNLLKSSLHCLVNQTYRPIEIIVIDHDSIDNTKEVADSFGKIVKYFKHTGSFRDTFNVWRDMVKGEFIAFHDDDDYILPQCLEKLANILLSKKNIDVVFSRHRFYYNEDDRCVLLQETRLINCKIIKKLLLRWNVIPWNAVLFRKNCLSQVPKFADDIVGAFDWFFWIHLVVAGFKFYQVDEVLGVIKRSSDSVQLELERMSEGGLQCLRFYSKHINIIDKFLYQYYYVYGYRLIRHGMILLEKSNVRDGRRYLIKGIIYYMFSLEKRIYFFGAILVLLFTFITEPRISRKKVERMYNTYLFRNYFEIENQKKKGVIDE